jgi:6-phospho-beta-glucosidase
MKIAIIGGGSTYTPELVNGFLERSVSLPVSELWLEDIDPARLAIVGGFATRMVQARGEPFKVILSQDQKAAIQGASYVITQLRVGQMPARVADEYLGLRHGLIGQETTGVGGMAKALRTIPVILQVARWPAGCRSIARQLHQPGRFDHPGTANVRPGCALGGGLQRGSHHENDHP